MENPIKIDDLGGFPIFLVQHPFVEGVPCILRTIQCLLQHQGEGRRKLPIEGKLEIPPNLEKISTNENPRHVKKNLSQQGLPQQNQGENLLFETMILPRCAINGSQNRLDVSDV